jgi:MFS family permease
LLLVAALAGLGNAPFHPVDFTILNQRVSAPRLGHAFSAHGLTGNLGWAAAPVFLVGITALLSWRAAYLAAAVMYAVILLLLLLNRDQLRTEVMARPTGQPKGQDMAFLRMPVVWWCFAFFMLSTMTLALVQNYSVSLLKILQGVTFEQATFTLTAYMLCAALGIFVGGFVAARQWHSDRVVAVCMAAGAVLLALCGSGWLGATGTMVALASTGFAIGIGGPSRDMMVKKATPKGATGRIYGTVYSGFDVGFAVSPLLFGALMDRSWFSATFYGAAGVLLLSVFTAIGVGQRMSR